MPNIPYNVESHFHASIVIGFINGAIFWAYPEDSGPKQRSNKCGDDVFALVILQGKYKADVRRINREIGRQALYYCFYFFVWLHRSVLFTYKLCLPAEFILPISFSQQRAFAALGQTYHSAFLMSVVFSLECKIKGHSRLWLE